MKRYNVLFPMTGKTMGGSHVALLLILKNLPKNFNSIVYLDREGVFSEALKKEGIPYILIPCLDDLRKAQNTIKRAIAFLKIQFKLRLFFKKTKIDLIHVSNENLPVIFLTYGKLRGIPIIWHHHNKIAKSRLNKLACYLAHNNIYVSKHLQSLTPNIKGKVIFNPIKIPKNIRLEKIQQNYPFTLGFFANLYHQKRPLILLKALKILKESGDNFICYFYGNETEFTFNDLTVIAKQYRIAENIKFHHFTSVVYPILSQMDIVIAPAINESFGRVLIEAMACKTPVIASNHSGHKEIIQNEVTGLFFEPDNPQDLANQIKKLISDPILSKTITENAYRHVIKTYEINSHIKQICGYYSKVLKLSSI